MTATPHVLTPIVDRPEQRVWIASALAAVLLALPISQLPVPSVGVTELLLGLCLAASVAASERWASTTVRIGEQTHNLTLGEVPLVVGLVIVSPGVLLLARITGAFVGLQVFRRQAGHKTAFNIVHLTAETLVAIGLAAAVAPDGLHDGLRLTILGTSVAVAVATGGGLAMAAVMRITAGRRPPGTLVVSTVREGLFASLVACGAAVMGLALWGVSPLLLWGPLAVTTAIVAAHRSGLGLVQANAIQAGLLTFTRSVTGEEDVTATATHLVEATRSLLSAELVAIRLDGLDDGHDPSWIGVGSAEASKLDHDLALDGRHDEAGCCVGSARETVFAALPMGWLAVGMDRASIRPHDRSAVHMVGNHAAVVLANAERGTRLRRQAAEAHHQARHDSLTGLPNRVALRSAIQAAIQADQPFGVLLVDLNDFKQINDALGHAAGDEVLTELSKRLGPVTEGARLLSRLGGDEFAVVTPGDQAACVALGRQINGEIGREVHISSYDLLVGSSVGLALYPDHGTDVGELLKNADLAMYEAKALGGGVAVFGTDSSGRAMRQLEISSAFRHALQEQQLTVVFQPIIDVATSAVTGVEALTRWTHPELGAVSPDEFIAVAEQTGLITELTHFVLDTTLQWQRLWAAAGLDLQVAVNLSPRSLLDAALPRLVQRHLATHGLPANRLTLELTENSVITDPTRTLAALDRLSGLGVRLSVDDFGTGYSSLSYLRNLPIDCVKIDKSFVLPMDGDPRARGLVAGIIGLCDRLGFSVVAEGIETQDVLDDLQDMGCASGQGYFISRPLDGPGILDWVRGRSLTEGRDSLCVGPNNS